jgi:hypothetical protein
MRRYVYIANTYDKTKNKKGAKSNKPIRFDGFYATNPRSSAFVYTTSLRE